MISRGNKFNMKSQECHNIATSFYTTQYHGKTKLKS